MPTKYQTATTEQRAGSVDADGTPFAPKPPDDTGDWQLIGLHPFERRTPIGSDPFGIGGAVTDWFVHFYWQRAYTEPNVDKPKPAPTPMPGKGRTCPLP